MKLAAALAAAGLLTIAAASTNNAYMGTWRVERSSGTLPPPSSSLWGSVTSSFGDLYISGGGAGASATYSYNHNTKVWTKLANLPGNSTFRAADIVYVGGNLVLWGGYNSGGFADSIYTLSTVDPTRGWKSHGIVSVGPAARKRHTLTFMNGVVYMIGGYNDNQYFQGIWAMDVTLLLGSSATTWTAVYDDNTPPAGSYFSARSGHSIATYENRMYLFGGYWHNVGQGGNFPNCEAPGALCTWFQDLWMWTPPTGLPKAATTSTWQQITPAGGVSPPGRQGHAAAFVEDNRMLVFGGIGGNEIPLNDLWQFDEHTKAWTQLTPGGVSPPAVSTPLAANIGRVFIMFASDGNQDTVYDYFPYDFTVNMEGPVNTFVDNCVRHSDVQGINAGLVIAILIGIAQLVFGILVWRGMGGGSKAPSPYSSMPAA